jgi:hypothetical protein
LKTSSNRVGCIEKAAIQSLVHLHSSSCIPLIPPTKSTQSSVLIFVIPRMSLKI